MKAYVVHNDEKFFFSELHLYFLNFLLNFISVIYFII